MRGDEGIRAEVGVGHGWQEGCKWWRHFIVLFCSYKRTRNTAGMSLRLATI